MTAFSARGINEDMIHEHQSREVFGTEFLRDVGSLIPFGNLRVTGERDNQQVTLLSGKLEISNVARMNDVEAAVTLDNSLAGLPGC